MKVEQKTLIFSSIVNFGVAIIKIVAGNIFGFASLIADGFYTVSDFITDILAIVGAKVSKKRPNKRHPFGYGSFEDIMQMIMGFMIFLVGVVVIFMSFYTNYRTPSLFVIIPIILVVFMKFYSSNILLNVGKRINSSILITSSKESFLDGVSSSVLIGVILVSQFFKEIDRIGSIVIGLLIIYQAYKIISQNVVSLLGENIQNEKIDTVLNNIFARYKKIKLIKYSLIKHGYYYHLILNINISKDYTIRSLLKAEINIKKQILRKKLNIRFIDFDIGK